MKRQRSGLRLKRLTGRRFTALVAGLVLVAGLAGFGVMYALGRQTGSQAVADGSACRGNCVLLRADGASPDLLTVTAGSYVKFAAADGRKHNLSLVSHGGGDHGGGHDGHAAADAHHELGYGSGDFAADEAWRVQFKQDGTFTFTDKYNPKIHINVVVYTPGKDYKVQ